MNSDRAIESEKDDRLGFGELAEKLAEVINGKSARDGFVIGIEGKWGSGKSSLINLTRNALENLKSDRPEIVFFAPWLIGNREGLLTQLLGELARAAEQIDSVEFIEIGENDRSYFSFRGLKTLLESNFNKIKLRKTSEKWVRSFGDFLSTVAPAVKHTRFVNPYAKEMEDGLNLRNL